jgi:hypothetical protein
LAFGSVGLLAAFGARGVLLGVAVPALGIGLSWLFCRSAGDRFSARIGTLLLVLAGIALLLGARSVVLAITDPEYVSLLLGISVDKQKKLPTFDFVIQHLGHGLFPWSAVLPIALGRLLYAADGPPLPAREIALRTTLLLVPSIGLGMYGFIAPITGHIAFGPTALLAASVAVALRDFERGAAGSRAAAMVSVALAVLLFLDFKNMPEKGFSAFAVPDAKFPESFKAAGTSLLQLGLVLFVVPFFAALMEQSGPDAKRFDRSQYRGWYQTLRTLHSGNVAFFLTVAELSLLALFLLRVVSDRYFHFRYFEAMAPIWRGVIAWGWLALPCAALFAVPAAIAARDLQRALFSRGLGLGDLARVSAFFARLVERIHARAPRVSRMRLSRAVVACVAAGVSGAILSFGYYPALAAQISPREVFESYRALARPKEPLGMIGMSGGSASYYAGREVPTFETASAAFNWLVGHDERRWLVIRSSDLAQMNSLHRSRIKPAKNLPVLDGRSSEILLVSNRLTSGQTSQNPLDAMVSSTLPKPGRALDVSLGRQLDVLGWDVRTKDGGVVDAVVPGKPYRFSIYYRVKASISGNWETFIHIDGYQKRFNGDHPTLQGKYPLHLWHPGDYIVDVHDFALEPNFTPGSYGVFFGLFIGNRRLEVERGEHHENRVRAGTLEVR